MREDKSKAILLRKNGGSYRDIQAKLGIPRSTLSEWFQNLSWSKEVKHRLTLESNEAARRRMTSMSHRSKKEREKLYRLQRSIAKTEFEKNKHDLLFKSGLMLYWSEGDSSSYNGAIRLANSDPLMLKLFHSFLKKYFSAITSKIRMYLILYPDLDEERCKKHWAKIVGVNLDRFYKSSYIHGKCTKRKLLFGVGNISIISRLHKETLHTWIQLQKREISRMRV